MCILMGIKEKGFRKFVWASKSFLPCSPFEDQAGRQPPTVLLLSPSALFLVYRRPLLCQFDTSRQYNKHFLSPSLTRAVPPHQASPERSHPISMYSPPPTTSYIFVTGAYFNAALTVCSAFSSSACSPLIFSNTTATPLRYTRSVN